MHNVWICDRFERAPQTQREGGGGTRNAVPRVRGPDGESAPSQREDSGGGGDPDPTTSPQSGKELAGGGGGRCRSMLIDVNGPSILD